MLILNTEKLSRETEKIVDDDAKVSASPETTSPDALLLVLHLILRCQTAS